MFYDKYCELCKQKGISPSAAAIEMGINKGTVSVWKSKGTTPQTAILSKIADYFCVSMDYLLGNDPKEKAPTESGSVTDDDLKFALFNGSDGVTDEMYEEVKRFAMYIKEREKQTYRFAARGGADHIDLTKEEKDAFDEGTEKALNKPQRDDLF